MRYHEYVKCIADTHQDNIGWALCGRRIGSFKLVPNPDPHGEATIKELAETEFVFGSIDHWYHNARARGRLVGCPKCLIAIRRIIGLSVS